MNIYSIIVCYNPIVNDLKILCKNLISSGSFIILVDNTDESILKKELEYEKKIKIIVMGHNQGIAAAQNIGIKYCLNQDADIICFFDQDSVLEDNFIDLLTTSLKKNEPKIVVPIYFDKVRGIELPSMKFNRIGLLVKQFKGNQTVPFDIDVTISSGMAATKEVFEIGGVMDEDFFIDYVDTEWCLRCRNKGIPLKAVPTAKLLHSIGNHSVNFGIVRTFVHSPIRCYYKIRNLFIFSRKPNIPFGMLIRETISSILHHFLIILLVNDKSTYIQNYKAGIIDGLNRKVGKK